MIARDKLLVRQIDQRRSNLLLKAKAKRSSVLF